MSEDLRNVPRRLRRFYRHGQPVPADMQLVATPAPIQKMESFGESDFHSTRNEELFSAPKGKSFRDLGMSPLDKGDIESEPWMNPPKKMSFSEPTKNSIPQLPKQPTPANTPTNSTNSSSTPTKPTQGLFSRVMEAVSPHTTHVDKALGLEDKKFFQPRMPNQSEKAIAREPSKDSAQGKAEIEKTLAELKKLTNEKEKGKTDAQKTQPQAGEMRIPLTTSQFTPAASAPNLATPAPQPSTPSPSPAPLAAAHELTPRERAEMRRMQQGQPPAAKPNQPTPISTNQNPNATPANTIPTTSAATNANVPAHIRRRMGQVVQSGNEGVDNEPISPSGEEKERDLPDLGGDEDFQSLLGGSKDKKKKKVLFDDDEDFDLDKELGSNEDGGLNFGDEDEK